MHGVKGLQNVLTAIVQAAIAKHKAQTSVSQILLVLMADSVADKSQPDPIVPSSPFVAICSDPDLERFVIFGVGEGFVLSFIPSPAAKHTHPFGDRLLEIQCKTILDRRLPGVIGDFRASV